MRAGFWKDVLWGLRYGFWVGLVLSSASVLIYLVGIRRPDTDPLPTHVVIPGGFALGITYCCYVGGMIGALRPLLRRGESGAALAGAVIGATLMTLIYLAMLVGGFDFSPGSLVFVLVAGGGMGAVMGLAFYSGFSA